MNQPTAEILVRVARRTDVGDIAVLDLEPWDGGVALPAWTPGSHVDVLMPDGVVRQYSLCGAEGAWRLAVLDEPEGRGGSHWLAGHAAPGVQLVLAGPRNHFPFEPDSRRVLLIAGGIGITPILPMAYAARLAGIDVELHYAGHEGRMAFLGELSELDDAVRLHVSEHGDRLDVRVVLTAAAAGTAVWCCGPVPLVDEVEAVANELGLPLHLERFVAKDLAEPVWEGEFEVELAQSGETVIVPAGRSILEVVEEAGVFVLSSCHEGTCGTCETPVLSGGIDHRDSILTPAERERGDRMFICVSRSAGPRIVLDL